MNNINLNFNANTFAHQYNGNAVLIVFKISLKCLHFRQTSNIEKKRINVGKNIFKLTKQFWYFVRPSHNFG